MSIRKMIKKSLIIFFTVFMVVNLIACGGDFNVKKPEGLYFNTEVDFGDGLTPVSDVFTKEYLNFNPNGSGVWISSIDMDFKWKLKGDTLTITREVFNKEEVYTAVWDGEKILLNYDETILLFEKVE